MALRICASIAPRNVSQPRSAHVRLRQRGDGRHLPVARAASLPWHVSHVTRSGRL